MEGKRGSLGSVMLPYKGIPEMRPRWGTETATQWSGFFFISQDLLCCLYQARAS